MGSLSETFGLPLAILTMSMYNVHFIDSEAEAHMEGECRPVEQEVVGEEQTQRRELDKCQVNCVHNHHLLFTLSVRLKLDIATLKTNFCLFSPPKFSC